MMVHKGFDPGDSIVFRGLGQGKIWYALPVMVVKEAPDLVALFWRAGTRGKFRGQTPGAKVTPQEVISDQMVLFDKTWTETDVLMLVIPGAAHAVYVMWEESQRKLRCWYVNLQQPLARTAIGFDTEDYWLDIVVSPDRSKWRWKDKDQFEEAVAMGMYTPEKAREIRAEGERVIGLMQTNQPPFCGGWENWQAPGDWNIPCLPDGWDCL
jgi:hypothetical protein